ncbi:hypothetical protein HTZ85_24430 [Escherichia coli]|nr:hypothetical protein [Escherichia coli]
MLIHVKLPLKRLSPAPKRCKLEQQQANAEPEEHGHDPRQSRRRETAGPPVPKRRKLERLNRLMRNQKNRSIAQSRRQKPLLPVPKPPQAGTATG